MFIHDETHWRRKEERPQSQKLEINVSGNEEFGIQKRIEIIRVKLYHYQFLFCVNLFWLILLAWRIIIFKA
jgi:hypothetical protein